MPVPEAPGRVVLNAWVAVVRARRGVGQGQAGHDRVETHLYAVKRYLWRRARRAGVGDTPSGRFACSIWQLAVGLAPIVGWPPAPPANEPEERARWLAKRRRSLKRWLEDLQAMGVLAYQAECDQRGRWWRTIITLRAPEQPPPGALAAARARIAGWPRREAA